MFATNNVPKTSHYIYLPDYFLNRKSRKRYRATNNKSLKNIYNEIDELEKTKIEVSSYKHYAELFFPFAFVAILLLLAEMVLRYTVFKSVT